MTTTIQRGFEVEGFDPANDVLDITPGYNRIGERTVRVLDAPPTTLDLMLDQMAEQGISPDETVETCDDCGRPWGDCDPEVEH